MSDAKQLLEPPEPKPSSVPWYRPTNYDTAMQGLIFQGIVGSTAYGLNTPESDIDMMGVAMEQPEHILGLQTFDHFDDKSVINGIIYGLKKFLWLVLKGNPTVTELLWVDPNTQPVVTPTWKSLLKIRDAFLSHHTIKAYLGYLIQQRERLEGSRGGKDVNRRDLVEKYGYDTKYAMHAMRLGMMGSDLMNFQKIELPMDSDKVMLLMGIRNGQFQLDWVLEQLKFKEMELAGFRNAMLPPEPDYGMVERWLMKTYREEVL